jgi:hypothetical protein
MQSQRQLLNYLIPPGSIGALILAASLAPAPALAAPPATVATCEGIADAYPILGKQCATAYANINHAPGNAKDRLATFVARRTVLQIFQKALLCNGMYGASSSAQQAFSSAEDGHLQALANVRATMVAQGDPNIPAAYTRADLKSIKMTKQQCK